MLGALMMQLDMTMTTIATRTLVRDFHSTLSTIQWVTTGYMLAMAATIPLAGWALERFGARRVWTTTAAGTSQLLLAVAQVCSGIGTGAALVPIMSAGFRGLEPAAVPRASSSIRIMQQLGGSFGGAALFVIVQHELATHAHNAAGLAAAFGATFWWVLAFAGAMLIPVLFLPGGRGARGAGQAGQNGALALRGSQRAKRGGIVGQ